MVGDNEGRSKSEYKPKKLSNLLGAFEALSGLPLYGYLEDKTPQLVYPENTPELQTAERLALIAQCRETKKFCQSTDGKTKRACMPIMDEMGSTIGYLMIESTGTECSKDRFQAALSLFPALIGYIVKEELVTLKAKKYINDFYKALYTILDTYPQITAEELVRRVFPGQNRNVIYDQFKTYVHMSVLQYINYVRLCKAKDLLSYTEMPVYQISDRVGFSDYNYFIRVFKKKIGQTPEAYRSKHKMFI